MDITKRPLTGAEIQILNPDAKVIKYTELYNYDNVEDLFSDGTTKIIILYLLQSPQVGHWTTLFINQDGLNYFDSYGVPIDYEFELLSKQKRRALNQETNYLLNLLKDHKVIFNNITYQGGKTATCGCFVSHRLHYSHLNDIQYLETIADSGMKPDILVAQWCFNKLDKL